MDFSDPNIKKVLIFSQKKLSLYFGKQNFLIFSLKKAFLIFQEAELSYTPRNGTKKFEKGTFRARKTIHTLKKFFIFLKVL